uniref:WD_REPEATS_REGION domain-containing protein n=1 Tax=Elaeophora elaphi TaxID=1147741 RepID=A0A0R3RVG9_9BILA
MLQKRKIKHREEEDQLAKRLFGSCAGFPDGFEGSDDDDDEVQEPSEDKKEVMKKPVWQDEDDEVDEAVVDVPLHRRKMHIRRATDTIDQKITPKEYEERLRQLFSHSSGAAPAWSQFSFCESKKSLHDGSDDDDLEDALREVTAFTGRCVASSNSLPKGVISVKRLNNITRGHRFGKKPMRALQFHPTRKVLMCAGENGFLSLFEIGLSETEEAFLQNVRFKAFPITSASFTADGSKIIVGSKTKEFLFCYDLLDGKIMQMRTPYEMTKMNMGHFSLSSDGKYIAVLANNEVHILTSTSSEYIGVLTASTKIASVQFSPNDSSTVFALGRNGQVFIWNIRKLREQQTFYDEGSVRGTVIRISENGQYIACGSNTGIVNLYDSEDVLNNSLPKPVKMLDNLRTSIDCMAFNTDSQILSVSSSIKSNSIRLMHVGSRTVYKNFPPRDVRLGKVTVTDFSPKSAYMAVGDDQGFLSLLRLSHFTAY